MISSARTGDSAASTRSHQMPIKHRKIALMGYRSVGLSSSCNLFHALTHCPLTGKSTLTAQYVEGRTIDFYDPTIENSESGAMISVT